MKLFLLDTMRIALAGMFEISREPAIFPVILSLMKQFLVIFPLHVILLSLFRLIPYLFLILFVLGFILLVVRPLLILSMPMMSLSQRVVLA